VSAPDPEGGGAYRCMKAAAWDANIDPTTVSLVQCHATSTHAGDIAEMLAVRRLLGPAASNAWISATKGSTGHLLSASGSLEAIFAVLSTHEGVVPPMRNLQKIDPELCKGGAQLPKFPTGSKPHLWTEKRRIAIKNSFGFGGSNAAVIFANYES
jgi:3-oxoacyl-[acyl-carrier-protein] synthase II